MAAEIRLTLVIDTKSAQNSVIRLSHVLGVRLQNSARKGVTGLDRVRDSMRKLERGIFAVRSLVNLLRIALLGIGATRIVSGIVDAVVSFERIENVLRVATGSAKAGREEFAFVRAEARRLGLDLESTAFAYSKFAAAANAAGFAANHTREIFTAFSEVATVLGLKGEDTRLVFLALEQMVSKGRVQTEELRRQLGERIPAAFNVFADAIGKTTGELTDLLRKGQIAPEAIIPFARELKKQFGDGLQNALQLTGTEIRRLKTSFFEFQGAIGMTFAPMIRSVVMDLTTLFNALRADPAAAQSFRDLSVAVFTAIETVKGSIIDAVDFLSRLEERSVLTGLAVGSIGLALLAAVPFFALLLSPIGVMLLKLIALTAASVALAESWDFLSAAVSFNAANALDSILKFVDKGLEGLQKFAVMMAVAFPQKATFFVGAAATILKAQEGLKESTAGVTDAMRELAIEAGERGLNDLLDKGNLIDKFKQRMDEMAKKAADAANGFGGLSNELEDLNPIISGTDKAFGKLLAKVQKATAAVEMAEDAEQRRLDAMKIGKDALMEVNAGIAVNTALVSAGLDPTKKYAGEIGKLAARIATSARNLFFLKEATEQYEETQKDAEKITAKVSKRISEMIVDATNLNRLADAFIRGKEAVMALNAELALAEFEVEIGIKLDPDARQKFLDAFNFRQAADQAMRDIEDFVSGAQSTIEKIGDVFVDAFADFVKTGEFSFEELGKALLDVFVDVLADMLREWISTQAKMLAESLARIAKEAAAQRAANNQPGVTPSGGGTPAVGGGGTSGAAGAGAVLIPALVIAGFLFVIFKAFKNASDNAKRDAFDTAINIEQASSSLEVSVGAAFASSKKMVEAAEGVQEAFRQVEDIIGQAVVGSSNIQIQVNELGNIFKVLVDGQVRDIIKGRKGFAEAVVSAIAQSLNSSDLSGVGSATVAVIRKATTEIGLTMEEFVSRLELAAKIDSVGLSETEKSFKALELALLRDRDAAIAAGISLEDFAQYALEQIGNLGDSIRARLGIGEQDPFKRALEDAKEYNKLIQKRIDASKRELELLRQQIAAQLAIEGAEATIEDIVRAQGAAARETVADVREALRAVSSLLDSSTDTFSEEFDRAMDVILGGIGDAGDETINNMLGILEAIDAINKEIEGLEDEKIDLTLARRPGTSRPSGPTAQEIAQQLADLTRSLEDMIATGLTPFEQKMRSLKLQFEDLKKEAERLKLSMDLVDEAFMQLVANLIKEVLNPLEQFNPGLGTEFRDFISGSAVIFQEAFDALNALKEEGFDVAEAMAAFLVAIEGFKDQLREKLIAPFKEFIPSIDIRETLNGVAASVADLIKFGESLGFTMKEINDIIAQTGEVLALNLLDNINKFVKDEQLKAEIEQARAQIEIANLTLQLQILRDLDLITDELADKIQTVLDIAKDNVDNGILNGIVNGGLPGAAGGAATATNTLANELDALKKQLLDQVEAWEDLGLSGPEKELRDLNRTFAEMMELAEKTGFSMERLQAAFDIAIEDFWDRMLQPLRDFQDSLSLSEFSPLTPSERLKEAQLQFDDLVRRALAGDLSALEQIPGAAQQLLSEAQGFFASSQGFQDIFNSVNEVLNQLLGNAPGSSLGGAGGVDIRDSVGNLIGNADRFLLNGGGGGAHININLDELCAEMRDVKDEIIMLRKQSLSLAASDLEGKKEFTEKVSSLADSVKRDVTQTRRTGTQFKFSG